ncbi:MAG: hypothetical protein WBG46_10865 [Nonlabens sp.]
MKITRFVLLVTILLSGSLFAQKTEVTFKADSLPTIKERGLAFIHEETNLENYYKVGSVEIKASDFNDLVIELQAVSNDLFANAFKYKKQNTDENGFTAHYDLYSVSLDHLRNNDEYRENNVIYFFGNDAKIQKFKINMEKMKLEPGAILKYEIPKNEEVKINKGGFMGMSVYHFWEENQPVIFYAFGSGNLSSSNYSHRSLGFNVSTGKILPLRTEMAYLFMALER